MDSAELRQKFLDFFEEKGHKIVPSSSLVTSDQTVLFTTAGMQQFKPYYFSEKSPYGDNVATSQKCLRVSDIEEVGDEGHLTFFEMLGNFSFGGYFKKEAIKLAKEFLDELNIKIDYVTVFEGDKNTPRDEESAKAWGELGFSEEKGNLRYENKQENFWGPTGEEGPCGPTTEIYSGGTSDSLSTSIEIWNIVFNQYYCLKDKKLEPLKTPGIDTGMGLERILAVINSAENIFHTDLFEKSHQKLHELLKKENPISERIILDHLKAATFILAEHIEPSNIERGYILRRLIRRAIRHGRQIGIERKFCSKIAQAVIDTMGDVYPEIINNKDFIFDQLNKEEEKFEKTLENGLREFEKLSNVSGKDAFNLYQTYGFPIEITEELAKEKGIKVDVKEFKKELGKHQELSRTASAGMFKGGLADTLEQTTKLHTAAHLMLAGLRKVLGDHVVQKGSNITAERLRFDFTYKEKMSSGQIGDVENFVNGIIEKDLPVSCEEMTLEKAKELDAMGVFESKYGQTVKVYTVGDGDNVVSREICGGPHVDRTGILGHFKITKEESSSSGVRRIRAILSPQ
ncbi:MAG: alanine--tRNA ligase [bacterium]